MPVTDEYHGDRFFVSKADKRCATPLLAALVVVEASDILFAVDSVPAVLVALTVSPTTALLTALLFLGIQQLEGNFLTPKIQGDTLRVHPVLVFLAVIIGGGLAGIVGVIVAVPSLAVLRVLFDFFRVRLTTEG